MTTESAAGRKGLFSYENALLLILGSSFGFAFMERQAISYLTPFIVTDLHLNNTQVGAFSSGLSLTWALSAYGVAAWSDATGVRKPFLLAAIAVFTACSVLSGLAGSFMILLIARLVMGSVEGPFLPICLAIMGTESSPHRRGLNFGTMQNAFSAVLLFFAPIVLVWLAERYGWRPAFYISAAPGLVLLALVWRYVREPAKPAPPPAGEPRTGLIALLKIRNVWLCCLISICMVGWTVLLAAFMPLYFVKMKGMTPADMGILLSVLGIATGIGGPLLSALSDRVGRKPVVIAFCLVGLIVPAGALLYSGSLVVTGALILIGWLGSGTFPLFMGAIPGESVPPLKAATVMGLVVCIGELAGGFVAPLVGGKAADMFTLQAPILGAGVLALCGAGLALFLRETAPSKVRG